MFYIFQGGRILFICLFVFPKIKINGSKLLGKFSGDLDTTHCKVQL